MTLQLSDVSSSLAGYFPLLRDIVIDGFKDYSREYSIHGPIHSSRTRACLIHDHIVNYAKHRLRPHKQFTKIPIRIRNLFDFDGQYIFQFKKLSKRLQTSNIRTQLTLALESQRGDSLPGILPNLPRLAIGYVPKDDWTDIDGVFITFSIGRKLQWHIDLTNTNPQQQVAFEGVTSNEKQSVKRVRAKVARRKESGGSASAV